MRDLWKENLQTIKKNWSWSYYKTYYLWPSVGVLIALVLFAWFIKDTVFPKRMVCAGCAYGIELSEKQQEALQDGYIRAMGLNPKKAFAGLSTDNIFEDTNQQMDANEQQMALIAQVAAGDIHYLIFDERNLLRYQNSGIYEPLDEVLSEDVLQRVKGNTYSLTDSDSGEEYLAAIDLKALGLLNEEWQQEGYLIFTIGVPSEEFADTFFAYLCEAFSKE